MVRSRACQATTAAAIAAAALVTSGPIRPIPRAVFPIRSFWPARALNASRVSRIRGASSRNPPAANEAAPESRPTEVAVFRSGSGRLSNSRMASASLLSPSMASPPPSAPTKGSIIDEDRSRQAALTRSVAPRKVFLTLAAAPSKRSSMPRDRASRATPASSAPSVISSRICAPVLPIWDPIRVAASMPRSPNWFRSSAVILAEELICDMIRVSSEISWLDPPVAATAFWIESR